MTMDVSVKKPLVMYVNPAWRRPGSAHTPLLNPWWGNPYGAASVFTKELLDHYKVDTTILAITADVHSADLVLLPYRHVWCLQNDRPLLAECIQVAEETKLPLLVDGSGDVEYPVGVEHSYVLRTGGYRFLSEPGRILVPFLADDLLERCRNGTLSIRKKGRGRPVVGFAGWASVSPVGYIKTLIKELPMRTKGVFFDKKYLAGIKGVLRRRQALRILRGSNRVILRSVQRGTFSASAKTAEGNMFDLREDMVNIILESDYALDVRGDANNSTRLFEILSLGRIPVIVDTERNFPFSDEIDYASFALIIDFRDIQRMSDIVADFHEHISDERFEQMQRNARDAYLHYFRFDAWTRRVVEHLAKSRDV